ncbi:hypothetical protein C8R44DRAFT_725237 [Mycena epipterygia]|nr:hypothetical protein C8R44DRAFT_725237 [Mycena epipterygia]
MLPARRAPGQEAPACSTEKRSESHDQGAARRTDQEPRGGVPVPQPLPDHDGAPGWNRGHEAGEQGAGVRSTDAFKVILAEKEARENAIVVEDDDDGMQGIEVTPDAHRVVGDADRMHTRGDINKNELDMDEEEELELLYPGDSPVNPGAHGNGDSASNLKEAPVIPTLSGAADGSTNPLLVPATDVPSSHQLTHMFDSNAHRQRLNARHPLEHLIAGDDMDVQVDFPTQIHMDVDGTAREAIGRKKKKVLVDETTAGIRVERGSRAVLYFGPGFIYS